MVLDADAEFFGAFGRVTTKAAPLGAAVTDKMKDIKKQKKMHNLYFLNQKWKTYETKTPTLVPASIDQLVSRIK